MADNVTFEDIALEHLGDLACRMKNAGCRCVQMFATNTENGIDLTYSFDSEGVLENYRIKSVPRDREVPSLQSSYPSLFPFENEAAELFGVNVIGMEFDFGGTFYALAQREPMTVISPAQKAAREKAAKLKAAMEAKAAREAAKKDGAEAPAETDQKEGE